MREQEEKKHTNISHLTAPHSLRLFLTNKVSFFSLQEIFEKMDWDKNGTISCIEFKSYLAKLKKGEELDHAECVEAFNAIDVDGSKQINWNEFFVSTGLVQTYTNLSELV